MATVDTWQATGGLALSGELLHSPLAADPGLRDLLELFAATLPQRLENLERFAEQGDWENLRRQAHQLKGAAGSYGFAPLSVVAAHLEAEARHQRDPERVRALLEHLRDLASRVSVDPPT